MSFIHDLIKIKFVREGYLPNYPPHLLSDEEMCDAFIDYPSGDDTSYLVTEDGSHIRLYHGGDLITGYGTSSADTAWERFKASDRLSWFKDKYPLLVPELEPQYRQLVEDIVYHLTAFKQSLDDKKKLPDWIYCYMLGDVLSVHSNIYDLHDMLIALGVDNVDDIFTPAAQAACYNVSELWLARYSNTTLEHRHATLFGEPHVLKSLRLSGGDS